jgi:hypothetical protein
MAKRPFWSRMNCWVIRLRVRREPVPNQQDVAGDVAEQVFEKLDDLFGLDGAFEDLKVEVPEGDASNHRQGLPVEMELQDWRLPARRPRAPPAGASGSDRFRR